VDHHRTTDLVCQAQLVFKGLKLVRAWTTIAVVVEADFT
jgi:hypothetical protein